MNLDNPTFRKAPKRPRPLDMKKGLSLWIFEGLATIDTPGPATHMNAVEARKVADWLVRYADWNDHKLSLNLKNKQ